MPPKRFSKSSLLFSLKEMRDRTGKEYRFDRRNGYAQVKGKGDELNRAYGKWDTLNTLIDGIEGGYVS